MRSAELIENNPMDLVRVKDSSKRLERPSVITAEEFQALLPHIREPREPYRTMVLMAACLGLRAGEIMGLKWSDFDFDRSSLFVQRSVVHGRADATKTEYSADVVPLAPELAAELRAYRESAFQSPDLWLFANPAAGKPYHQEEIQKKHLKPAAKSAGIAVNVGWKTFRHSYRSWLDQTDAPIGVQRESMRHAIIQTTMNVYGRAYRKASGQHNNNVVQMVLKPPEQKALDSGTGEPLAKVV